MSAAYRLTPGRDGNTMRRRLLRESRHEPWSGTEGEAHRLLDDARLTGRVTNARVLGYRVDVLFEEAMLVLQIDGWEVHGTRTPARRTVDGETSWCWPAIGC